jgi:hypothetical protein
MLGAISEAQIATLTLQEDLTSNFPPGPCSRARNVPAHLVPSTRFVSRTKGLLGRLITDRRANEQKIGQRRVAVLQPSTSARVF